MAVTCRSLTFFRSLTYFRLCLQLAPFPFDLTLRELRRYPNAEVMWVQVRHSAEDLHVHSQM